MSEVVWASAERAHRSKLGLVAVRSVTLKSGEQIIAGVTRIRSDHRWLGELPGVFALCEGEEGKEAIRARSESGATRASEFRYWFR